MSITEASERKKREILFGFDDEGLKVGCVSVNLLDEKLALDQDHKKTYMNVDKKSITFYHFPSANKDIVDTTKLNFW